MHNFMDEPINETIQLNHYVFHHNGTYVILLYGLGYTLQILPCIIGNLLQLYILPRIKHPNDYIAYALCTLAFFDLLQGIITMPANFIGAIFYSWVLKSFLCKFLMYMYYTNTVIGIWITVYIGFDRFINICYPFQFTYLKNKRFCKSVLIIICIGNIMMFFYAFLFATVKIDKGKMCKICFLQMLEIDLMLHRIFIHIFYMYALPMLLLIIFYASILYTLFKFMTFSALLSRNSKNDKEATHKFDFLPNLLIEKVLLFLVIFFIISNFPLFLHKVFDLTYKRRDNQFLSTGFKELEAIGHFMQTMASCLNPWIYSFYSKKFRREVNKVFCGKKAELIRKGTSFPMSDFEWNNKETVVNKCETQSYISQYH